MFNENLVQLRKLNQMTQEDVAEKVGVSRQAVAKWESGETSPDINACVVLAEIFGVSLDDLVNWENDENLGLNAPPRGKHLFGIVTVGDKGQIVIPAKARKIFNINPGEKVVVLGDEGQGIAIVKAQDFLNLANMIKKIK
jgi:AbrB family looped-hinge helix DNA binding protein